MDDPTGEPPRPPDPTGHDDRLQTRLRDTSAAVTGRIADTRRRLEEARPRSVAIDAAFRAVERDTETGGGVLSGAVAFRIFLFLVPMVFVLVVTLGVASDASDQPPAEVARRAGVSGITAQLVSDAATQLSVVQRIGATIIGLFTLYLATRAALKVLNVVHALIWRVPPLRLKGWKPPALLIGLVLFSVVSGVVLAHLRDAGLLGLAVEELAGLVIPGAVWWLASWLLPHEESPWWALLPGAVVFAVGTAVLRLVTITWIAHQVSTKSNTYGTIGAALALLLWAYLLGRLITAAAVVNATLWRRNASRIGLDPAAGGPSGPDPTAADPTGGGAAASG